MSELVKVFEAEHSSAKEALAALGKVELPDDGDELEKLRERLKSKFDLLDQGPPSELADKERKSWLRDRGFKLEVIVFKMLALERLAPGTSYYADAPVPSLGMLADEEALDDDEVGDELDGDLSEESFEPIVTPKALQGRRSGGAQVDGFFELDQRFFLVETKWTTKPIPASELFAFRGRVEGKLVGTLGVVISAGDFAKNAGWTLLVGRAFNVILVNKDDLALALNRGHSFSEMLRVKVREAARTGRAWYSYKDHLDNKSKMSRKRSRPS